MQLYRSNALQLEACVLQSEIAYSCLMPMVELLGCSIRQSQDLLDAVSGSHSTSSYTNLVVNSNEIIMTRDGFECVIVLIRLSVYIRSHIKLALLVNFSV